MRWMCLFWKCRRHATTCRCVRCGRALHDWQPKEKREIHAELPEALLAFIPEQGWPKGRYPEAGPSFATRQGQNKKAAGAHNRWAKCATFNLDWCSSPGRLSDIPRAHIRP